MRELIGMEPTCVATGQNATASTVDGCGPVRPYDVVDCPQSAMGKVANDIANGSATVVGMIADSAKALWGSIFGVCSSSAWLGPFRWPQPRRPRQGFRI